MKLLENIIKQLLIIKKYGSIYCKNIRGNKILGMETICKYMEGGVAK